MNYREVLEYINNITKLGSDYGLTRMEKALERLGNPEKSLKIIHIGGTNGKGSTSAILKSILMESGYKVGAYTSPALERFNERIVINNNEIDKAAMVKYIPSIKAVSESLKEEGYGELTEFEVVTCLMFKYFCEEKVDYAIVEVGLGGRLDATNVVIPIVSAFASISRDHMNILGNTISEITKEKCGIIKWRVPVITYPQKEEVLEIIEEKSREMESEVVSVKEANCKILKIHREKEIFQEAEITTERQIYRVRLKLLGEHQVYNAALAINIAEKVLEEKECLNIVKGIEKATWKGRLEVLSRKPLVVIDGAHNIGGIETLEKNIKRYFDYENLYLIIGILHDKEVEKMIRIIAPLAKKIITVTPLSKRAEKNEALKREVEKINKNVRSEEDYKEALDSFLRDARENDMILATGSLYMIGKMRGIIKEKLK